MPLNQPAAIQITGDGHVTMVPINRDTTPAGTWTYYIDSGQNMNGFFANTSGAADLDNFTLKAHLAAGTYTLRVYHIKSTNRGIVDIDIDGVEVGSYDGYAGSGEYNQVYTETGIVIAALGVKTITVRLDGKNGSSSGYQAAISLITLWRTS